MKKISCLGLLSFSLFWGVKVFASPPPSCNLSLTPFFEKRGLYKIGEVVEEKKQDRWLVVGGGRSIRGDSFWTTWPELKEETTRTRREIFAGEEKVFWGFVDAQSQVVIEAQYDDVRPFCQGLAAVKKAGKWGYINRVNETKIDFKYNSAKDFSEDLAPAKLTTRWAFIDKQGVQVCPVQGYYRLGSLLNGLAGASPLDNDGDEIKFGFIDRTCKFVIPAEFEEVKEFNSNLARVKKNGKWGLVNRESKIILETAFDEIAEFKAHPDNRALLLAHVTQDSYWGYVNQEGKIVEMGLPDLTGAYSGFGVEESDPQFDPPFSKMTPGVRRNWDDLQARYKSIGILERLRAGQMYLQMGIVVEKKASGLTRFAGSLQRYYGDVNALKFRVGRVNKSDFDIYTGRIELTSFYEEGNGNVRFDVGKLNLSFDGKFDPNKRTLSGIFWGYDGYGSEYWDRSEFARLH